MTKRIQIIISIMAVSVLGLSAMAQQNVTIKPGDDVNAILETVVDEDSTITFEAGYYVITRDGSSSDLLTPPPGTTVRGAGSGFDPAKATILDCAYTMDSAIKIDDGMDGITIENLTVLHTIDSIIEVDPGSFDNTLNNVWAVMSSNHILYIADDGEIALNDCVLGWCTGDTIFLNDPGPTIATLTNCDIFLGNSDIVEGEAGTEMFLRNCILYAGNGSNDIEADGGWVSVASSVGWDPFDGDEPGNLPMTLGRLDVNGDSFIDESCVGEDPLYVKAPGPVGGGVGHKMSQMDLHLQEGSPALTAGSTSFDADSLPTGDPTYAGSQGPAPVDVGNWSIY